MQERRLYLCFPLLVGMLAVAAGAGEAVPARGEVPEGFMLMLTAPGCDPGEDCDDVGPPRKIRRKFQDLAGQNTGHFGIDWGSTQKEDPGDGEPVYDFSGVTVDPWERNHKYLICHLRFFGNPWAEKFRFTDIPRYNRLLEQWAEAACRYARETYGDRVIFSTGGNERDLVAPETYRPYFPDWHYYYMDPIKAVHRGMKKAHPDNRLIIGQLCYSDRDHIGALYEAGAKGNFEILAIHAYGPRGSFVDMEQVIESHQEMAYRGDPDIPIILTEGWSCFPLPDSIDKDPTFRGGTRPYTPAEIEHYRQTVLDGWRNLTTPRPGEYDPKWVCGASYFVLNDHWGGRGWEKRARAEYDEKGNLKGFHLDGYFIGTTDPNWIKPYMRPWGLIDIEGKPKGDTIYHFPPYIPRHEVTAQLLEAKDLEILPYDPRRTMKTAPEVIAGRTYHATVRFRNLEDSPMTDLVFTCGDKSEKDYPGGTAFVFVNGRLRPDVEPSEDHLVKTRLVGDEPPKELAPGASVELQYELVFSPELAKRESNGVKKRIRPYADVYYVWEGRPYHTDAWLPRVSVRLETAAAPR